jgi:hypothetical protein
MQRTGNTAYDIRTGWASWLARVTGGVLLFHDDVGPSRHVRAVSSGGGTGLLLHTAIGVLTIAPMVCYFVRHWADYSRQTLSDVLILGYVAIVALTLCSISGLAITWRLS